MIPRPSYWLSRTTLPRAVDRIRLRVCPWLPSGSAFRHLGRFSWEGLALNHLDALVVSRLSLLQLAPLALLLSVLVVSPSVQAQQKPRARDLGIPFDGTPGPLNAITDVKGVEVGQVTLVSGQGKLTVGEGPVRTGVTAIL